MKHVLLLLISTIVLLACQPCRTCKYATQKGTVGDTFCSSIPEDRKAFEAKWDSLAKASGSEVICTHENY